MADSLTQLRQDFEMQRQITDAKFNEVNARLDSGDDRFKLFDQKLDNAIQLLSDLKTNTDPMINRDRDVQGVINIANRLKKFGAWLAGIPLVGASLLTLYEHLMDWLRT